jgi:hypothetical protein
MDPVTLIIGFIVFKALSSESASAKIARLRMEADIERARREGVVKMQQEVIKQPRTSTPTSTPIINGTTTSTTAE